MDGVRRGFGVTLGTRVLRLREAGVGVRTDAPGVVVVIVGGRRSPGSTAPGPAVPVAGGGAGSNRDPSEGAGGCTPGATPAGGGAPAMRGLSAGPDGAGECWPST